MLVSGAAAAAAAAGGPGGTPYAQNGGPAGDPLPAATHMPATSRDPIPTIAMPLMLFMQAPSGRNSARPLTDSNDQTTYELAGCTPSLRRTDLWRRCLPRYGRSCRLYRSRRWRGWPTPH